MSARIVYQDVAPGAADDAAVTATGQDAESTVSLLPFGSSNAKNYITLERNLWVLDGTYIPYDNSSISYRSEDISDANGDFSTPKIITINFDEQYTSLGINITFTGDTYCKNLNIKWYQESTQLDDKDFSPDGFSYFCENTVIAYDRVVITMYGTQIPLRRIRVDEILFGIVRVFYEDELRTGSVKIQQEIDNTGLYLPSNALDWILSSNDDVEFVFQTKQIVKAYNDENIIGAFYIEDSDRAAENIYDIKCIDAIGVLDDDPFPDAYYSNKNALVLAQEICGDFSVEMETALQNKTISGVLKDHTRRSALQQLCFALGAVADTSGTEKIKIFALPTDTPIEIGANRTRTGATVRIDPIVTEIRLVAHSYSTSGSDNPVEINGTTYYDTQTVVTIHNPDVTANEKPNVVEVSDCTLISPDIVQNIAQHFYDEAVKRRTHKLKFRLYNELPGAYVQTVTPWGTNILGHYIKASIMLSSFALSDAEVIAE